MSSCCTPDGSCSTDAASTPTPTHVAEPTVTAGGETDAAVTAKADGTGTEPAVRA
ncbi:hypothetical protein [Streptomyces sp. NPDC095602]|uniref:hypothetical protein n=1 Tax=Streptomyces sp. NPDC095602 TaxID=3155819 RepID=UPI0033325976